MSHKYQSKIMTGTGTDLAFAMVVMVTYFLIFTKFDTLKTVQIFLLIILGVVYLANGIYGYGFCVKSSYSWANYVYFGSQIIISCTIVYLTDGIDLAALLFLPIIVHSSVLLESNGPLIFNLLVVIGYALSLNFSSGIQAVFSHLPILIGSQFFIVSFTQMVINEERSRIEIEGLVKDLEATNEQLKLYANQVEELTLTRERNRIAREIHDGLGHYLTTISMQIKAAQATMKKDPESAAELLSTAETLSDDALKDVRQSISALRDTKKSDIPFTQRLTRLLKPFENTGYITEVNITGHERQLTPEVEVLFFRALQEGLSNIGKHSNASKISVIIHFDENGDTSLTLTDDGIGANALNGGYGIIGLRERAEQLSGVLTIETNKNKGFTLKVMVPKR